MVIDISQAKKLFLQLLQRVAAGEEITIVKAGVPVARLVPPESKVADCKPEIYREQIAAADDSGGSGPTASTSGFLSGSRSRGQNKPYTEKQGQYLAFIDSYTKTHRRAPSELDMQIYFRVSPPSVHQMVLTLERRRLIERTPGQGRSIRVLLLGKELPDLI